MKKTKVYIKDIIKIPDELVGEQVQNHLEDIYGKRKLIRWEPYGKW